MPNNLADQSTSKARKDETRLDELAAFLGLDRDAIDAWLSVVHGRTKLPKAFGRLWPAQPDNPRERLELDEELAELRNSDARHDPKLQLQLAQLLGAAPALVEADLQEEHHRTRLDRCEFESCEKAYLSALERRGGSAPSEAPKPAEQADESDENDESDEVTTSLPEALAVLRVSDAQKDRNIVYQLADVLDLTPNTVRRALERAHHRKRLDRVEFQPPAPAEQLQIAALAPPPAVSEPAPKPKPAPEPEPPPTARHSRPPMLRSVPSVEASTIPKPGELVLVRQRQYLVEVVHPAPGPKQMTRLELVCLDDDNQGRPLDILWELELGARRLDPAARGLSEIEALDPPRHFAAYFHAIKWSCVTATDAKLFQAPFRAGIRLFQHQLAPLRKALELPRVNLFIADDVGLGKTIEAGLVMQEMLLRQRLDFILIVTPAAITLQWRDEMERRFGLGFEIYNRAFVARRRKQRGYGVNPWTTHNRFIISYQTLRRPEYRDPLLAVLGERPYKTMLLLDEAHNVAPASAAKYAVDSQLTKMTRDIAERFEHRLFLSATPHNGHSNSFSALLEILDPQRFTRGVKVTPGDLEPIMVRRLKQDLRAIGQGSFPDRRLLELRLTHEDGRWWQESPTAEGKGELERIELGEGSDAELELSRLLAAYAAACKPTHKRGKLVFINLQKRLLSSVEAFFRTLTVHARSVGHTLERAAPEQRSQELSLDAETYGSDDDGDIDGAVAAGAASLDSEALPTARLDKLLTLAKRHRYSPTAKLLALLHWVRTHQCQAACPGGVEGKRLPAKQLAWTDTRLLIFTEYADTKRFLQQFLSAAIAGTQRAAQRIATIHGGMSEEGREAVQIAFNGAPAEYPVRILIATDAAREGVNLQGHCADLVHFDIPWNPARLEQRNGRIDRTLQPAKVVRCMYFTHPQREEDRVLATLVHKVGRIQTELGSLASVVMDRMERALADGIDERTGERLERASAERSGEATVMEELESLRGPANASSANSANSASDSNKDKLRAEIDACAAMEESSRRRMDFDPLLLEDAIDVGCRLAGAGGLTPAPDNPKMRILPELPRSWARTLDSLRPIRPRDEEIWEWRKRPLLPVAFEPGQHMSIDRVHLHLQHPFVQRVLGRFLAQGFSAYDLSRVTVVRTKYSAAARVMAFGRLSLFGRGAARLHDQIIPIVAPWLASKGKTHLQPFVSDADREALLRFEDALREAPVLEAISDTVREQLRHEAPGDFASLWPHLEAAAAAEESRARELLAQRGSGEAEALRGILARQQDAITKTIAQGRQRGLEFGTSEREQHKQHQQDLEHMQGRLAAIDDELKTEPARLEAGYQVMARRLEPVGLVYLWPENR